MKVRTFLLGDYAAVKKVWADSGLGSRPGDDLRGIRKKLSRDAELFLVAEEEGKVVGTVMGAWDGRRGWIYHLGVLPSHHRRGVASALIKEMERRMKRLGVPKLNALIYPWNDVSAAFFTSAGYEVAEMKEAQKWLTRRKPERRRKA